MKNRLGKKHWVKSGREEFRLSLEPARSVLDCKFVVLKEHPVGSIARLFNQGGILFEIAEPKHRHAGLLFAQKFAGSAQLQISAGNFKAVGRFADDLEALPADVGKTHVKEKHAGASASAASDAAPELMKLSEAEAFGMLDHHQGGVGDLSLIHI